MTMIQGQWLAMMVRKSGPDCPLGWDEMVVGYDFGLLAAEEIQGWARTLEGAGEAVAQLAALEGEAILGFERALWAVVETVHGKVPRPGFRRWARAQDRWRVALLQDALEAPVSPEHLAVLVEAIYENVGCPEDMLGLWRGPVASGARDGDSDRARIQAFLRRRELDLLSDL
jgi:hypothetical protein